MSNDKVKKTDEEWRAALDETAYQVTRGGGTERAFSGKYWNEKRAGVYHCVGCGAPLFSSETKYDSGSGWPSFTAPTADAPIETRVDRSHGMVRTEVACGRCDAHLGHAFPDGPAPTGTRFCINSAALNLSPARDQSAPENSES